MKPKQCSSSGIPEIGEFKCNEAKIKSVLFFKASDMKVVEGKLVLKRKYGRFKRLPETIIT